MLIPHDQYKCVLDYGCGLGLTARQMGADGVDINNYNEVLPATKYWLGHLPNGGYDDIYFMHSIAHIPNLRDILVELKHRYNARVTVITPNKYWLMLQSNNDYVPDPTVHQHYTSTELRELFELSGYEVTIQGQFGEEKTGVNERLFLQAI
jgi:hypothetical protein